MKIRGEKFTGRVVGMKRFRVVVPELGVLKYGPKKVYFCNMTHCVEKVLIIF